MSDPELSKLPSPERVMMRRRLWQLAWRAVALLAAGLGLVGLVLPVMPTVPFMILAAWAASQGWPEFEAWLLRHRTFGPPIRHWRERGAVPRRAKWLSSAMMSASAVLMWALGVRPWVLALAVLTMAAVALWMWRRPEH